MSIPQKIDSHLTTLLAEDEHLISVLGPTASGKTSFSIQLAKYVEAEFSKTCEIICVDSRQVYRDISITSTKITPEEMQGIVHHGLDLVNPDEEYSVYNFQQYCFRLIPKILERGNVPILCGGTMLWLDAVTEKERSTFVAAS